MSAQTAIRRAGGVPFYVQLADILEHRIAALDRESLKGPLPSEGELAREYKVSRITVRQALKRLESRGLIYSEQGRGSFPTVPRLRGISGFHSFTNEVLRNGGTPGSKVLKAEVTPTLPEDVLDRFAATPEVKNESGFFMLSRVRTVNAAPVAIEDAFLPREYYPGIDGMKIGEGSLYELIGQRWGIEPAWTDALLEPAAATKDQAKHLRIKPGAPVLVAWRVTLAVNDQVIEFVRSVYRGSNFALHIGRYRLS